MYRIYCYRIAGEGRRISKVFTGPIAETVALAKAEGWVILRHERLSNY